MYPFSPPSWVSTPVAPSRENVATAPDTRAATYTLRPSRLTARSYGPSRPRTRSQPPVPPSARSPCASATRSPDRGPGRDRVAAIGGHVHRSPVGAHVDVGRAVEVARPGAARLRGRALLQQLTLVSLLVAASRASTTTLSPEKATTQTNRPSGLAPAARRVEVRQRGTRRRGAQARVLPELRDRAADGIARELLKRSGRRRRRQIQRATVRRIAMANVSAVLTAVWQPTVSDQRHPSCTSGPAGERANTPIALEKFDGVYAKRSSGLNTTVCGDCSARAAVQPCNATTTPGPPAALRAAQLRQRPQRYGRGARAVHANDRQARSIATTAATRSGRARQRRRARRPPAGLAGSSRRHKSIMDSPQRLRRCLARRARAQGSAGAPGDSAAAGEHWRDASAGSGPCLGRDR